MCSRPSTSFATQPMRHATAFGPLPRRSARSPSPTRRSLAGQEMNRSAEEGCVSCPGAAGHGPACIPRAALHRLVAAHKVRNPVGFPRSATIGGKRLLPVERGGGDLRPDHATKNVLALPGFVRISLEAPVLECANCWPRVEAVL